MIWVNICVYLFTLKVLKDVFGMFLEIFLFDQAIYLFFHSQLSHISGIFLNSKLILIHSVLELETRGDIISGNGK